jgi:hypothetical protein
MIWESQATLVDRPRGIATLAAACAHQNVVLLELRTDQGEDGRFADAVLLATPGGFTAEDVEHLFADVHTYGNITATSAEDPRFEAPDELSRARGRRSRILVAARRPGRFLSTPTRMRSQPPAGAPTGQLKRALAGVALILSTSR